MPEFCYDECMGKENLEQTVLGATRGLAIEETETLIAAYQKEIERLKETIRVLTQEIKDAPTRTDVEQALRSVKEARLEELEASLTLAEQAWNFAKQRYEEMKKPNIVHN
jgi:uncharacterized coiled-coil protein SlyX